MSSTVEIGGSAEDVFAVVSDFSRNLEWQTGMRSARWLTDPPIGVGSSYEQVARFLGRDVVTTFEVVDFEPGRWITIESRRSSFPLRITRSVTPISGERSVVSAEIWGDPGGFFRVLAPIAGWLAARSVRRDYQRLRRLLESDPSGRA